MDSVLTSQRIAPEKRAQAKHLRQRMTVAEKRLWHRLRANRFHGYQFRRQQIIDGFIADFYCHTLRLIIEVDGPIHDAQIEYDRERDSVLSGRGLTILRIANDDVLQRLSTVLARIEALADERVPPPF